MTYSNTDLYSRQRGVLRIEIAAIGMLLLALTIVLVTHAPPGHQPGVAQASEPVQVLPAVTAGTPSPLLVPVAN